MTTLEKYLFESKKTYKFKIRAAGELPEGFEDRLETALNKYQIVNFTKGKRTPITERPLDFPQLQNCEVTSYDAELSYPTTNHVLESYLSLELNFPDTHLSVHTDSEPLELEQTIDKNEKDYTSLLATENLGGESAQDKVGENRVMDLLKELEQARKENEFDPIRGVSKAKE